MILCMLFKNVLRYIDLVEYTILHVNLNLFTNNSSDLKCQKL